MDSSPMINMRRPHVPEEPPPVLTEDDLRALLKTCNGLGFEDRRDAAIIRLFVDSGMRVSELTGLSATPWSEGGPTATLSVRRLGEELDYHFTTYRTRACGCLPSIVQPYRLAGEWALFRADYAVVNVLIAAWSGLHSSPTLVGNAR